MAHWRPSQIGSVRLVNSNYFHLSSREAVVLREICIECYAIVKREDCCDRWPVENRHPTSNLTEQRYKQRSPSLITSPITTSPSTLNTVPGALFLSCKPASYLWRMFVKVRPRPSTNISKRPRQALYPRALFYLRTRATPLRPSTVGNPGRLQLHASQCNTITGRSTCSSQFNPIPYHRHLWPNLALTLPRIWAKTPHSRHDQQRWPSSETYPPRKASLVSYFPPLSSYLTTKLKWIYKYMGHHFHSAESVGHLLCGVGAALSVGWKLVINVLCLNFICFYF